MNQMKGKPKIHQNRWTNLLSFIVFRDFVARESIQNSERKKSKENITHMKTASGAYYTSGRTTRAQQTEAKALQDKSGSEAGRRLPIDSIPVQSTNKNLLAAKKVQIQRGRKSYGKALERGPNAPMNEDLTRRWRRRSSPSIPWPPLSPADGFLFLSFVGLGSKGGREPTEAAYVSRDMPRAHPANKMDRWSFSSNGRDDDGERPSLPSVEISLVLADAGRTSTYAYD